MSAKDLSPEVLERIPIKYNRDDRYFTDKWQGLPIEGFTNMFENMLDYANIKLKLRTSFKQTREMDLNYGKLIYTGPIDEFFDYKFVNLPYRSVKFLFKTYKKFAMQEVGVINYPNTKKYTRSTEFKQLYMQEEINDFTTICYEYPGSTGVRLYPVPREGNVGLYRRYFNEVKKEKDIYFSGRLGLYSYLNMDKLVKSYYKSTSFT